MNKCKFDVAWCGACKAECEGDYCLKHSLIKCASCGAQATRECDETFQFVCGAPLCPECEHRTAENGTNGGMMCHCKKTEQKNKPWYLRGVEAST